MLAALVLIGAHGHNQYLYKRCVAVQHGVPPALAGVKLPLVLPPGHHLVAVGSGGIPGYAFAAPITGAGLMVHCERSWP